MLAMITRFPTGMFLWTLIGLGVGYTVSLMSGRRQVGGLIPMAAGLAGALVLGGGLGLLLSGYRMWECNAAACVGALGVSTAWEWLGHRRAV